MFIKFTVKTPEKFSNNCIQKDEHISAASYREYRYNFAEYSKQNLSVMMGKAFPFGASASTKFEFVFLS